MLSKPGSNNLYLKVPPSIGIGQQCINAFGYHGNGVATTYIPSSVTSVEQLSVAEFRDET